MKSAQLQILMVALEVVILVKVQTSCVCRAICVKELCIRKDVLKSIFQRKLWNR